MKIPKKLENPVFEKSRNGEGIFQPWFPGVVIFRKFCPGVGNPHPPPRRVGTEKIWATHKVGDQQIASWTNKQQVASYSPVCIKVRQNYMKHFVCRPFTTRAGESEHYLAQRRSTTNQLSSQPSENLRNALTTSFDNFPAFSNYCRLVDDKA